MIFRMATPTPTGQDMPVTDEQLLPSMRLLPRSLHLRHDQAAGTPWNVHLNDLTLRLTTKMLLDVPLRKGRKHWERDWSMTKPRQPQPFLSVVWSPWRFLQRASLS